MKPSSVVHVLFWSLALTSTVSLASAENAEASPSTPTIESPGRAEPAATTSLKESLPEAARADYESAMWLWEAGDYGGARLKFQVVYARSGDPRLLWNLAVCEKALRRYARALPLVKQYLEEAGHQLSAVERQEATDFLATIEGFVGPVRVESDQASARVFVDDEEVGKTPLKQPLMLDMGDHEIKLKKRGFKETTKLIRVLGPDSRDRVYLPMERDIPAATLEVHAGRGQWIAVDGNVVGRDRWEGLVSPGLHRIRITGIDCKPQDAEADLSNGGHTSVWVTARPLVPAEKGYLWPLVGVLVSVTAVIGVVTYYGLRPDDTRATQKETGILDTIEIGLVRGGTW